MGQQLIYLDHAAATPLDSEVLLAMQPYLADQFYNPSSLYTPARAVRQALEEARHQVAQLLGARPTEVVFTAGATESINLAISGVCRPFPDAKIITLGTEHEAVLAAARASTPTTVCQVLPNGLVDIKQLAAAVDDQTVLVSVHYANNEIGTVQPLAKVAEVLEQIRQDRQGRRVKLPLYLHTDASQAANYLDLHVNRLGVDLMSLNGSKLYGPKQTGCLYIRSGVELMPLIHGGGQERGLRSGTENVAGSIGFAKALEIAQRLRQSESRRLLALRDAFLADLRQHIPDVHIHGDLKHRLPNNINAAFCGASGEMLVHYLDQAGVLAATGSACRATSDKPSHVLLALGLPEATVNSSLRLSLGRQTTAAEMKTVLKLLIQTVQKLRNM